MRQDGAGASPRVVAALSQPAGVVTLAEEARRHVADGPRRFRRA